MHVFWKLTIVCECLLKKYLCDFLKYVFIKQKKEIPSDRKLQGDVNVNVMIKPLT